MIRPANGRTGGRADGLTGGLRTEGYRHSTLCYWPVIWLIIISSAASSAR
ncbi:hypothetical protein ATKI12_4518 [Kitasatospora sp. Ki12]